MVTQYFRLLSIYIMAEALKKKLIVDNGCVAWTRISYCRDSQFLFKHFTK